ncbi:putative metal chaperone YciC [compost metagenome]
MSWMENWPEEVVRAKGIVWLATRGDFAQSLSQAGPSIQFGPAGRWAAALPKAELEDVLSSEPELADRWDDEYGDRLNKVVLIGIGMDRMRLTAALDSCLLSDEEMKLDWNGLADGFPNASEELLQA